VIYYYNRKTNKTFLVYLKTNIALNKCIEQSESFTFRLFLNKMFYNLVFLKIIKAR